MTRPLLYFAHGWSYDQSFWQPVIKNLAEFSCHYEEAGYFGASPSCKLPQSPYIAIGHSAGVMNLLKRDLSRCVGLISFNGFARFSSDISYPEGITARVLERMMTKLSQNPEDVISSFRRLCGEDPPALPAHFNQERLIAGLQHLIDEDARLSLLGWDKLLVNIVGSTDPLLPSQKGLQHPCSLQEIWQGGHLLPQTHSTRAARLIRDIANDL
ncbi:biotin synthase [Aristophania vespae]|uniref:Biotin synthase n=1 Tax=Aristophania vespae TaxID=2697033 RepID=A0A6P1NH66_9PROT|nr:alpha/beta hydrolase [Aristophania vespae]QHI95012.1 biotin synthase [Aristophania vespae]